MNRLFHPLFALAFAAVAFSGCVETVTVSTNDTEPPFAGILGISQYSDPATVNSNSSSATLKCGEGEPVQFLATGHDPKGVRRLKFYAVSGGTLIDENNRRSDTLTIEKDTIAGGKGVNRILVQAKAEFFSAEQSMVVRAEALDWAGNKTLSPTLQLQQYKMPVARINASASVIDYNTSVTIQYESENGDKVFLNDVEMGTKNGSKVYKLTADQLFTLKVTGVTGTATATTKVFVNPQPSKPTIESFNREGELRAGGTLKLHWQCHACTEIRIEPSGFTSTNPHSFTTITMGAPGTYTYTLIATGPGGSAEKSMTFEVPSPQSTTTCFSTNRIGDLFSFMKTGDTDVTNGNVTVNYSEWKMDLSFMISNEKITSITNLFSEEIQLWVGTRTIVLQPGATTQFFNGMNVNNVYQVAVYVLGNTPPAFMPIEVCHKP